MCPENNCGRPWCIPHMTRTEAKKEKKKIYYNPIFQIKKKEDRKTDPPLLGEA